MQRVVIDLTFPINTIEMYSVDQYESTVIRTLSFYFFVIQQYGSKYEGYS